MDEETEHEQRQRLYKAYRDELLKRDLSNTESYDKAVLFLPSAALGVSTSTIDTFVPLDTAHQLILLKSGWALLTFTVIFSLAAHLISNKAIKIEIEHAEKYYLEGKDEFLNKKNKYRGANTAVSYSVGATLSLALGSMIFFIFLNI